MGLFLPIAVVSWFIGGWLLVGGRWRSLFGCVAVLAGFWFLALGLK